jgi:hypothetical protein
MLNTAVKLYGVFQLQILYPVLDATAWSDKQQHRRRRRRKAMRAMRTAEENEKKRIAAMTAKGLLPLKDPSLLKEIAV